MKRAFVVELNGENRQQRKCRMLRPNPLATPPGSTTNSGSQLLDISCARSSKGTCLSELQLERLAKLAKHKVFVSEVSPSFHKDVFGAFLEETRLTFPKGTGLMATVRMARRAVLVQKYCPRDAWKPRVLEAFAELTEQQLASDWPRTAFVTVVKLLTGPAYAYDSFRIALPMVCEFLVKKDLRSWHSAGVELVKEACPRAFMHEIVKEAAIKQIGLRAFSSVNKRVMQEVLCLADANQDNAIVGKNAAEQQIVQLAQSDNAGRRAQLDHALSAHGLVMRADSMLCRLFVSGCTAKQLGEVVGIMRIAAKLFAISHRHWSANKTGWESALRELVLSGAQTSWNDAVDEVLSYYVKTPPPLQYYREYEDYSDYSDSMDSDSDY
jgi:hypothetical protein